MKQNLNKEQVLQEIQVLSDTIGNLIWVDNEDADYQILLGKVIDAKNDLHTYVLRDIVSVPAHEPTLEDKLEQLHEYLDTGSYTDITYLIVQLLEQIVRQISKEK